MSTKTATTTIRAGHGFPDDLPALTSIRFLLALGVVLFHYQLQWSWDAMAVTGLLDRARLGVDIFFILSGFVLTHAYRAALDTGRLDYRQFLVARIARIYPAHIAVLGFVLVMVAAAGLMGAEFDHRLYNPLGLLTTLLLVHAWAPAVVVAEWNGPSWSLSAEWFAYLAFPAFAWLGVALRWRPLVLLGVAALIFGALDAAYRAMFNDVMVHAEANLGILRIVPEFLYGMALYRLGERLRPSARASQIGAVAASAFLLLLMHFNADDRLVVVAAGPMLLSLALLSKTGRDQALARPWMRGAGEASYALYLLHMPILIGWKGVMSAVTGRPSSYLFAWWEVAALLAISIAAAVALNHLFEAPARRWIRLAAGRTWRKPRARTAPEAPA